MLFWRQQKMERDSMPTETLVAIIAIIVPFAVFMTAIACVDYYENRGRRS
jgi:hypothetical protein